jgi:putative phosphoesterase
MRLAVLSDIHDNIWKLRAALAALQDADVLLCCGDLCSPFVIHQLARGFPRDIHLVFGNNDADTFRITRNAAAYPRVHLHGEWMVQSFGGRRVAMNHFDFLAGPLAASGQFDAVFFGHNHVHEIRREGGTLAVNPGAIMGARPTAQGGIVDVDATFVIYDTEAHAVATFRIGSGSEVERVD